MRDKCEAAPEPSDFEGFACCPDQGLGNNICYSCVQNGVRSAVSISGCTSVGTNCNPNNLCPPAPATVPISTPGSWSPVPSWTPSWTPSPPISPPSNVTTFVLWSTETGFNDITFTFDSNEKGNYWYKSSNDDLFFYNYKKGDDYIWTITTDKTAAESNSESKTSSAKKASRKSVEDPSIFPSLTDDCWTKADSTQITLHFLPLYMIICGIDNETDCDRDQSYLNNTAVVYQGLTLTEDKATPYWLGDTPTGDTIVVHYDIENISNSKEHKEHNWKICNQTHSGINCVSSNSYAAKIKVEWTDFDGIPPPNSDKWFFSGCDSQQFSVSFRWFNYAQTNDDQCEDKIEDEWGDIPKPQSCL